MICSTSSATFPWFPVTYTIIKGCAVSKQEAPRKQITKTGHLSMFCPATKNFLCFFRDYFPSDIHSALPSGTFKYFPWRYFPSEISEPKPTAKSFLKNVSIWLVQHETIHGSLVVQRETLIRRIEEVSCITPQHALEMPMNGCTSTPTLTNLLKPWV